MSRTTQYGETATLTLWADGTYAIDLDGQRIATTATETEALTLWSSL